ncbi:MAG: Stk1 family PASTA domain-containing Ser/Thr kinase [Ruminococcus sp.]|nr:Stk1 family PASTA domain-containing Ser/Thr kinase [Ruminococcus sp.]
MDKNIGKKLDGRFEIIKLIGSGGMSDVYKARDIVDGSMVAVKILKKEYSENEEFLRRFRNESRAITVLSHPNIVKIIDVGFTNRIQYIVMEYIDGITLKEYMETFGILEWDTAAFFMEQILKALGHAHEKGIVHRDVKPQNIMLLPDGTIKVMDFGIAKFAREEGLTTTAQAIGSVHYISPEQARSDATDEKSDIYSAGIVFYEMLTGKKPFDNENPVSVALMHMQARARRPCDVNPLIPRGLEEIILRAMEKEPVDRYATAEQMIEDIEKFKSCPENTFGYYEEDKYIMDTDNRNDDEMHTKAFGSLESGKRASKKNMAVRITEPEDDYDDYDDYDDDDAIVEEYIEKRSMFVPILAGVVIVIIIIAAVFISGLMFNYFAGDGSDYKEFHVDNFVGHDYEYVKKEYSQYLVFTIKDSVYSEEAENTILDQNLEPGTIVKPGHKIDVTISKGPRMIDVPSLDSGFTLEQAKSILEEKKFVCQTRNIFHDTVPEGYVIKTEPQANTPYKEGSTVLVYISRGKMTTNVTLPDVQGKKDVEARQILEDLELTVKIYTRNSKEPAGTIVSQSHSPNTKVETGTEITLYASTGLPPTVSQEIEIPFPENANGVFAFKIYVDGSLNSEVRDVDSKYTTRKNISISESGGKKQITIILQNQGNGKEAELGRYEFSFDDQRTRAQISENITEAFKQVDGIKTAVQTTQAPVVTQAPPPETTPAPPVETTPAPTEPPAVTEPEQIPAETSGE